MTLDEELGQWNQRNRDLQTQIVSSPDKLKAVSFA